MDPASPTSNNNQIPSSSTPNSPNTSTPTSSHVISTEIPPGLFRLAISELLERIKILTSVNKFIEEFTEVNALSAKSFSKVFFFYFFYSCFSFLYTYLFSF